MNAVQGRIELLWLTDEFWRISRACSTIAIDLVPSRIAWLNSSA